MRIRAVIAITMVTVAALAVAQPASAKASKRADLTISASAFTVTAGVLNGSFTVRNSGRTKARSTWTRLYVQTDQGLRTVADYPVAKLKKKQSRTVGMYVAMPADLAPATHAVVLCADVNHTVREKSETNNCRNIGTYTIAAKITTPPPSSVPTAPMSMAGKTNTIFKVEDSGKYWAYVPGSYDTTHTTPVTLFVWLHGCGGESKYDIYTAAPKAAGQEFISIAVDGAEQDCWNMSTGPGLVKAAIASAKSHFNINPHRVILGGYSSGGDLAYRTAFYNADLVAGVLAINTSPFRDTGSTMAASLAAASWKFHVFQILHDKDTTYPPSSVVPELEAMKSAGFPVSYVIKPGTHYDAPANGDDENPSPESTSGNIAFTLLPYIQGDGAGWVSP